VGIIILLPKIEILISFPNAKAFADSYYHVTDLMAASQVNGTVSVNYYSVFPIIYAHYLFLLEATGMPSFYIPTIYYLVIELLTVIFAYNICEILDRWGKKNSSKSSVPIIAVLMYSILAYPNTSVLYELPQSTGLLSVYIIFFLILKIQLFGDHRLAIVAFFSALLTLSHPFAPLFVTALYILFRVLGRSEKKKITKPTEIYGILPLFLEVAYYSILPFFGVTVNWLLISLTRGLSKSLSLISGGGSSSSTRLLEVDMNIKYPTMLERLFYGLNWAIPTAICLSFILFVGIRILRQRNFEPMRTPNLFISASTFLALISFGLAFVFSPVEYAFSRYFGTYGVILVLPVLVYMVSKASQRQKILKVLVISILILFAMAMLTDVDYLPEGTFLNRERKVISEIASIPELSGARFLSTKLPQNADNILTQRTYWSTISFYFEMFSSSKPNISGVLSDPPTTNELQLYIKPGTVQYIALREATSLQYLSNIHVTIFYSNNEVYLALSPFTMNNDS
jgi:hypothetical protein